MRTRLLGVASAFAVALALFGAGRPVSATATGGTLDFTVSGGLAHAVGDLITITPTGTYTGGDYCTYSIYIEQPLAPNSPQVLPTQIYTDTLLDNGACPAWSFRLPNISSMVYSPTDSNTAIRVGVSLENASSGLDALNAPLKTITYSASTASVTNPTSSLPAIFWTLSPTNVAIGSQFTVTFINLGFDGHTVSCQAHDKLTLHQFYSEQSTCQDITTNMASPGVWPAVTSYFADYINVIGTCPHCQSLSGPAAYIYVQDPSELVTPAALVYEGDTSAVVGGDVAVAAQLQSDNAACYQNQPVTFSIGNTQVGPVLTDGNGLASALASFGDLTTPGDYPMTVAFAGTDGCAPASIQVTFTVTAPRASPTPRPSATARPSHTPYPNVKQPETSASGSDGSGPAWLTVGLLAFAVSLILLSPHWLAGGRGGQR